MKRRSLLLGAAGITLASSLPLRLAADTPKDQLVIGFSLANVLTLDPAGSSSKERVQIIANLYDSLVGIDDTNRRKVVPALAEGWEVAEDRMSVRLTLREARFSSGNPITAADAVWSLHRCLKLNLAQATNLRLRGFTSENAADHIRALDDRTVEITFPEPTDPQIILMTLAMAGTGSVIDRALALQHEVDGDLASGWLTTNVAGSGAFALQMWRPGELAVLERNDFYWDDAPAMTRIIMRHIPESQSQRLQLSHGDLDIAYSLGAADLKALESEEDVRIVQQTGNGLYYLAMSLKNEHLAKPEVREAIIRLIDYDGINASIMPYYGVKHLGPIQQGLGGEDLSPDIRPDPEAAKALLAKAGYPNGLDLTLRALAETPFDSLAAALQGNLALGGVRVQILTGSGEQVYGPMRERNFDLIVGRSGGQISPPDGDLRSLVYNPDNSDEARLTGLQSWRVSYQDIDLNDRIEAALLDANDQAADYAEISRLYAERIPAIQPISQVVDSVAVRANITGFTISPVWQTKLAKVTKT
ncbi:ABC transporter substrate-binding protein [Falsirhodobacter deserti]|uniref:ABC transporter substrate-binding protein n=1 Tax=Falsirhodobacter deserti TaxID=1365611 RepID=UPI000FE3C60B|nr:ABC transporter substrate-binding protein [Falsirhodobacter deserti]